MTDRNTLNRRAFLRTTGAVALGGALVACGDDPLPGLGEADGDASDELPEATAEVADAAVDTALGPDVVDDSAVAADTAADSGSPPDTKPAETVAPGLTPVRGDGSSPLDYIEHIVIVEMENRSFDHYFGALRLKEGRSDVEGLEPTHSNLDSDGHEHFVYPANGLWVVDPDPGHGHGACVEQFGDGTNSGFVSNYQTRIGNEQHLREQVMSYFQREELPVLYGLADAFTLCDHWHCSLLGPTWPNRFYSHAATSEGLWSNYVPLAIPTIYSKVLDAGVSYGVYHQSAIYFALTLLDPAAGSFPSQDLDAFFDDAEAGALPQVTVVEPDYGLDDDHPPHDIRLGQAFIASIYEALRQSPKWDRTLMIVFYDEHGGFYDHVVPPKAEGESRAELGFDQLGFRVPAIIAGGLAGRGKVFKDTVEHSSVPGLIARTFGLDHINERAERAGDLSKALDLELVLDARRPAAPALAPVEVPAARMEAAMRGRFRHPELLAFAKERGHTYGSLTEKRARTQRWIDRATKLGALRIV